MAKFKPGDKAIYNPIPDNDNDGVINPRPGEVVTIECESPNFGEHYWWIKEYPHAQDGTTQSFFDDELTPVS